MLAYFTILHINYYFIIITFMYNFIACCPLYILLRTRSMNIITRQNIHYNYNYSYCFQYPSNKVEVLYITIQKKDGTNRLGSQVDNNVILPFSISLTHTQSHTLSHSHTLLLSISHSPNFLTLTYL